MLVPNPEYIETLMHMIDESPYPKHMCMKLTYVNIDRSIVELKTSDFHLQAYGIVHGGVIATMIDTATFWSAFMRIPESAGLVNIDLKLNYLKPVTNKFLLAKGETIRAGNKISYTEAKVFNSNEELVAHGTSTLMLLPNKGLKGKIPKFLQKN